MLMMKYQPWGAFERFQRQFDQILANSDVTPARTDANWAPAVDIHEEDDKYVVHADLPGVESKDIEVTADKGVLKLSGRRTIQRSEKTPKYSHFERTEGVFERRFTLPENVLADGIRARHSNGVLEVIIPKQPTVEPRRVNVETH